MKLKKVVLNGLVLGFGSLLLVASGGGGGGDSSIEGYLVDSPIKGANYECVEGGSGVTDKDGKFKCKNIPVTFKIGGLEIGTISSLPKDKKVYPQDLIGVSRDNYTDDKLILLTRFLQSLDNDGVISENIDITEEVREKFAIGEFIDLSEDEVKSLLAKVDKNLVSEESALSHLRGESAPSENNPSHSELKTWIIPTENICKDNGGKYNLWQNKTCLANWKNANKICTASGAELPTIENLKKVVTDCGGTITDYSSDENIRISQENMRNDSYRTCYQNKGFYFAIGYFSSTHYKYNDDLRLTVQFYGGAIASASVEGGDEERLIQCVK